MAFNPVTSNTKTFNPSDPKSGGNVNGDMFFGCKNTKDKDRIKTYWEDLNHQYGIKVKYWRNGYNLEEHDPIYGEHVTSKFIGPKIIKLLAKVENMAAVLTQYGMITDADVQFYIPLSVFADTWGENSVPNRGDLIELTDEGCDRPEGQKPKIFQITNKKDNVEPTDLFSGHYVWYLEAKRFDYSYENNAPDEGGEPITNSSFVGLLSGGVQEESAPITYGPSADEEAKIDLDNSNTSSTYGGYL